MGWKRMEERGLPPRPVLGADTEVVLDDVIFGKPAGRRCRARDARDACPAACTTS